jgi:hypothetical protein
MRGKNYLRKLTILSAVGCMALVAGCVNSEKSGPSDDQVRSAVRDAAKNKGKTDMVDFLCHLFYLDDGCDICGYLKSERPDMYIFAVAEGVCSKTGDGSTFPLTDAGFAPDAYSPWTEDAYSPWTEDASTPWAHDAYTHWAHDLYSQWLSD